MKKILKGVSILLIVLISIISLVGCNNGIEGDNMTFETFEKALNLNDYNNFKVTVYRDDELISTIERLNNKIKVSDTGSDGYSIIDVDENFIFNGLTVDYYDINKLYSNLNYDKTNKEYIVNNFDFDDSELVRDYKIQIINKKLKYINIITKNDSEILGSTIYKYDFNIINKLEEN